MGKNGEPPAKRSKQGVLDQLLDTILNVLSKGSQAGLEGIARNNPALCIIPLFYNMLYQEKKSEAKGNTAILIGVPEPTRNFTGRTAELERINQLLNSKSKTSEECSNFVALTNSFASMKLDGTTSASISGLGGIGKTQLALMYAKLYARDYDYVIWLNAEQPSASCKTLAGYEEISVKVKDANNCDRTGSDIAQKIYGE